MADYGYTNGVNGRRLQDVIRVLRAEGVPWRVLALKQDALTTSQLAAVNSGATASTVAQVAQNTANIATLMQTVTAGLRLSYVEELPAVGAPNVVYLVPQADGEGVNVCNEYIYINGAYELIGRTGIQVNDGALTITVNGVTVGTFSANQAGNTTIPISIPTDTGDLTNNAGYIDATALAGALASYATLDDLASKQDALTDSQLAAVNSGITASTVAQVAQNADGITTLNILKANNVDVVHITGIETVGGAKTWTATQTFSAGAVGDLTGDVTGDLAGNVTGDVTGDVTGNVTGNVTGDLTGDVTGNVTGDLTGNVTGNVTGDLTGNVVGNVTGNVTGDVTGTASKATADASGNVITTTYATKTELSNTDATAVHKAGAETVTGAKTWTALQTFSGGASGNLTGNVTGNLTGTASKATADADGNTITTTYATKTELSTLSDTVGTKANDADVVHKADVETITGAKTFSATVTSADVVPSATDTYSLGSASVQYNAIYGKSYFYNGTQWGLDVANEWTNFNRIPGYRLQIKSSAQEIGVIPTTGNQWNGVQFVDKNNTYTVAIQHAFLSSGETRLTYTLASNYESNASGSVSYHEVVRYSLHSEGVEAIFGADTRPLANNTYNLGTSTNKWKTLNGINPGALSLPNFSAEFDVSGQIVPPTGESQISINWGANTFTPSVNSWLSIRIHKATFIKIYRKTYASYCFTARIDSADDICVCSPVVAGVEYVIKIQATQFSSGYDHFRLSPCQGNV